MSSGRKIFTPGKFLACQPTNRSDRYGTVCAVLMATDHAPLGKDGKPIYKFGFVKTISSLLFSDGNDRRGRVIDIKPDKNDKGNPDIIVSFDIGGESVVRTLKAKDLQTAGSPKAWLGQDLKAHGTIGEVVAWREKKGLRVGVVTNAKKSGKRFGVIDLDSGKSKSGLGPENAWHLDEADLTAKQHEKYEQTESRDRESPSAREDNSSDGSDIPEEVGASQKSRRGLSGLRNLAFPSKAEETPRAEIRDKPTPKPRPSLVGQYQSIPMEKTIGELISWEQGGLNVVGVVISPGKSKTAAFNLRTGKVERVENADHVDVGNLRENTRLRYEHSGLADIIGLDDKDHAVLAAKLKAAKSVNYSDLALTETQRTTTVSGRNAKLLAQELGLDEEVQAVVEYIWPMGNQALVATDHRLIVLKTGIAAGAMGGGRVSSYNWDDISGIQVNTGITQSTIVIQTPGMGATTPGDFWSNRKDKSSDPFQLPNVVPLDKGTIKRHKTDLDWIKKRQRGKPPQTPPSQVETTKTSTLDQLRQLGELRDEGILTEEEFNRMKTELIERTGETTE